MVVVSGVWSEALTDVSVESGVVGGTSSVIGKLWLIIIRLHEKMSGYAVTVFHCDHE